MSGGTVAVGRKNHGEERGVSLLGAAERSVIRRRAKPAGSCPHPFRGRWPAALSCMCSEQLETHSCGDSEDHGPCFWKCG